MNEIPAKTCHNKADWGAGPWQTEYDMERWLDKSTGYYCQIDRAPEGHLSGYVRVVEGQPLFGEYWLSEEVRALEVQRRNVVTVYRPDDEPPSYWLGFACNGLYEYSPGEKALGMAHIAKDCYITWEEVKEDVLPLAQQIRKHEQ